MTSKNKMATGSNNNFGSLVFVTNENQSGEVSILDSFKTIVAQDESLQCFLCDNVFDDGALSWFIFEKYMSGSGRVECSLSAILATALGRELDELLIHSSLLCDKCKMLALEFEDLEQRFLEIRLKILTTYNRTAKRHNLAPIAIEINGELQNIEENLDTEIVTSLQNEEEVILPDMFNVINEESLIRPAQPATTNDGFDSIADVVQEECVQNTEIEYENNEEIFTTIETETTLAGKSEFRQNLGNLLKGTKMEMEDDGLIVYDENMDDTKDTVGDVKQYYEVVVNDTDESSQNFEFNVAKQHNKKPTPRTSRRSRTEDMHAVFEIKGDTYDCLLCEANMPYNTINFAEHMQNMHNLRVHFCEVCQIGFLRRQDLNAHIGEQHSDGSLMECDKCQRTFLKYRLLRIHRRTHNICAKPFECTACKKKYSSKNLLDEHFNTHSGMRPYKCEQCLKDFTSKYTLQAHMKIHAVRERSFQCDLCYRSFYTQQNLRHHRKVHYGVKSYHCEICGSSFSTQHNLDVHNIVHTGERPFPCETCGKSFARRAELQDHERIHSGERPFKCQMCDFSFAQRANLNSHIKSTHFNEKLHKCNDCGRGFKRRRLLDYHINAVHTGLRPYKCETCEATFVYPEHYKKHLILHTGQKPYACEVCGKQFSSRDNRNAHRFIHSNKKPYECLECGAGFMRRPMLLAHMNETQHENDTIIINQPQLPIPAFRNDPEEEIDVEEIVVKSSGSLENLTETDENSLIMAEEKDENVYREVEEKYIEFHDLEDQTLIWQ